MFPSELKIEDSRIASAAAKVFAGARLSFEDGVALFNSPDLLALGYLANYVREKMHGRRTYFNVNRHINPTNVCVASCKLCAFGRKPDAPGAYTMALEQVFRIAGENWTETVTEFHIVGGLHPDLPFEYYCDLLRGLKQRFPGVHLKAFTAVEIGYYSHLTRLPIREILVRLKDAGLDSLPGGGAEIFAPKVRRVICDHKIGAYTWLKVHRIAHELGLPSNATMLYGHIESAEDRVDHLLELRQLQDETHGFQTYIPLAFHPANTELGKLVPHTETSGFMDLKNVAVARLLLDNFPHIKAYWIMMTPRVAQVALRFGADDLDGTVVEEKIYHDAGARTPQSLTRQQLIRLIREAGHEPVERDTVYRPVTRTETTVAVQV
ncbi:MAG TPA: aminofutalosine synthase MqnE [Terriglobia bacterium]|jgi:aminodeoxyfutalosine synthase|nr:aminofutalosine synthase MqnE [Terriglobia bacterium]